MIATLLKILRGKPEKIATLSKTKTCGMIFDVCFGYTIPTPPGLEKIAFKAMAQDVLLQWTSIGSSRSDKMCFARVLLLSFQYLRIHDLLVTRLDHKQLIEDNKFAVTLYVLMKRPLMTPEQSREIGIACDALPFCGDNRIPCIYKLVSSISK